MTYKKRKPKSGVSIYSWHRQLGIILALFLVLLASTGFLLNHTNGLKLSKSYITTPWLLDHYGIHTPEKITAYYSNGHWVSQWHQQIYLNSHSIGSNQQVLRGISNWNNILVIAFGNEIQLYTHQGQLIDKIQHHDVLKNIEAIGVTAEKHGLTNAAYDRALSQISVKSPSAIYLADTELLNWQPVHSSDIDTVDITWAQERKLPATLYQLIASQYRGNTLHLERVLQDLHSGRIFGIVGAYIVDATAVLLLLLALSGIRLWTKKSVLKKFKLIP